MENEKIIIIGAGAAGLMAARELLRKNKTVKIIEAQERTGGRIKTVQDEKFSLPLEIGAEFIHGNAPLTFKLLKEYEISSKKLEGEVWQHRYGKFEENYELIKDSDILEKHLKELKEDLPLEDFLKKHFAGEEHNVLRDSVRAFVQGYDAADTNNASTLAFKNEWLGITGEQWDQYRVEGGYGKLASALETECRERGCVFHTGIVVKEIRWRKGKAEVQGATGELFFGEKVLITVPLGVLQSHDTEEAAIKFVPPLTQKKEIIKNLGFGSTLKIFMQFNDAFWKNKKVKDKTLADLNFIFSDAEIPTWWTQDGAPILTGWLAGPPAYERKDKNPSVILDEALSSLAFIFNEPEMNLRQNLKFWKVFNWSADPFTLGSYAYLTVNSAANVKFAAEPVEDTLFFAGELYGSESGTGTVEAALESGVTAAGAMA